MKSITHLSKYKLVSFRVYYKWHDNSTFYLFFHVFLLIFACENTYIYIYKHVHIYVYDIKTYKYIVID